ncbi:MAG: biopolymer transporter ExbD [Maritimibacter sp.]
MAVARRILPKPREKRDPDFSLAIVNIVLLLILFFLATGALVNTPSQGVNISETLDLPMDQLPRPVLIIEPNGALVLDDQPTTEAELIEALKGERVLHVLIDRDAPALDLLKVLATDGLDRLDIKLVTAHKESEG